MDSSGRPGVDSNQIGQNTVTKEAEAVTYIKAIEASIERYSGCHGLPRSEHVKVEEEILNNIVQLESLNPKYLRQGERLRIKLRDAAILSCQNAMLLVDEQSDGPAHLDPLTDQFQTERQMGGTQKRNVAARSKEITKLTEALQLSYILFERLREEVKVQGRDVEAIENDTRQANAELGNAVTELTKMIGYRRLARRYKWWIFLVVSAIVIAIIVAFAITQA
ncbi:hypothetical protein BJX66DRAFT_345938 [Aspergillus keveii]|uniref:t-SNARE coiled-coil homology domain-containing protein n=1 Tax=Aspergillus keveii TaxID=714993 RepID=A0ABR4FGH6_9EURO